MILNLSRDVAGPHFTRNQAGVRDRLHNLAKMERDLFERKEVMRAIQKLSSSEEPSFD